jgi:hypothetical protein
VFEFVSLKRQLTAAFFSRGYGIVYLHKEIAITESTDNLWGRVEIYLDFLSRSYYTIPESYQIQDFSRYGEDFICIQAG